ncbi:unnamed protein product [Brassica rapa]|uniref:Uncharacterized protein n=1 Tax=Brassica campestris TaxID=3711 RepID=A0A3P5YC16_BRACM|nr:unnamed protein product [Brassica rapa]VDC61284.1 unnamed protein product [Brassica rapa]
MRSPSGDMRVADDNVQMVPHLSYVARADAPATYLPKIPHDARVSNRRVEDIDLVCYIVFDLLDFDEGLFGRSGYPDLLV